MAMDPTWEEYVLPAGDEFDRLMKLREMSPHYKKLGRLGALLHRSAAGLDFVFIRQGSFPRRLKRRCDRPAAASPNGSVSQNKTVFRSWSS